VYLISLIAQQCVEMVDVPISHPETAQIAPLTHSVTPWDTVSVRTDIHFHYPTPL